jgi:hypothetical protein
MPEPRDDLVTALHLSLKPAFVLCTSPAGIGLTTNPVTMLQPGTYIWENTHKLLDRVSNQAADLSNSPSRPRHVCRNARRTPSSTRRTAPPRCVIATGNIHTVIAATPLPFRRRRCARQGHDTPWTPSMRHRTASLHRGTRSRPPASPPS